MARVLCVWEVGANLGHLAILRPFIDTARELGHEVSLAARELDNIDAVLDTDKLRLYQAPFSVGLANSSNPHPAGYAEYLLHYVLPSSRVFQDLHRKWQVIFAAVKPDLVIHESAPTALITGLNQPWKKWNVGTGYANPRTDGPFLGVFPGVSMTPEMNRRLQLSENAFVNRVNAVLQPAGLEPLVNPSQLYRQCERDILLSYPELDHFGARKNAKYYGALPMQSGAEPVWPAGNGPRVFAYLGEFPQLARLLELVVRAQSPVILYSRGLSPAILQQFAGRVQFYDRPVDLALAFEEADIFLSHGNAGSATQAYVAGLRQLMIPKHFEQLLFSRRLAATGTGVVAFADQPDFSTVWTKLLQLTARRPKKRITEAMRSDQLQSRIRKLFKDSRLG